MDATTQQDRDRGDDDRGRDQDREHDRAAGRVWVLRLDPDGRPAAGTVKLSCSRPACPDRRLPSAAAGRKAAIDHVNQHLSHIRGDGGPRGDALCGCRAADCAWHTPDPGPLPGRREGARPAAQAMRCGGPMVLSVYADRAGRLWRIAETCARCAAATGGRVLDTAPPTARTAQSGPGPGRESAGSPEAAREGVAAVFSDHRPASPAASAPAAAMFSSPTSSLTPSLTPSPVPEAAADVPRARGTTPAGMPRRARRGGKIAQRTVPHDLQPDVLRVELVELGDAFRAYQKCAEPDLARLAHLHERKARAFASWADVTGDRSLRAEAERASSAAQTTREMYENRVGRPFDGAGDEGGPAVERLLTRGQAVQARSVITYVRDNSPHPDAEARLAVLLLTLRAARAGTGNVTGQDVTGWLQDEAEQVCERLVEVGWLRLPGTVAELLESRPEDPTSFTVPALLPAEPRPFTFGKSTRSRLSGWAQRTVGDRKIRKKKLGATCRLLALYTAAHSSFDGSLAYPGPGGSGDCDGGDGSGDGGTGGLALDQAAVFCALTADQVAEHVELLVTADWLAEAEVDAAAGRLRGRLSKRVLPLGALV
ncbi:hypothetical protein [Streptomyces sp. NPDC016845]|uniref:hypothetical protein n=1 Tax=Streptomyces sp. NPDC016845 TaxID=3364972 RepID=UPI0037B7517D